MDVSLKDIENPAPKVVKLGKGKAKGKVFRNGNDDLDEGATPRAPHEPGCGGPLSQQRMPARETTL